MASMTVLRSLAYRQVDDLLLVVHRFGELDDADWQTLMAATRRLCSHGADKALVLPGNVRLGPSHVSQIAEVVSTGRMRVAVLLEGTAARGAVAALGWLTKRYRAFEPHAVTQALSYLSIERDRHPLIVESIGDMRSNMMQAGSSSRERLPA
jgi:hypothetical protein